MLAIISVCLLVVNLGLVLFLILKPKNQDLSKLSQSVEMQNNLNKNMYELMLSSIKNYNDNVVNNLTQIASLNQQSNKEQMDKLEKILKSNQEGLEKATQTLSQGLEKMQQGNEQKLEQMRQTVDEKLNVNLQNRLSQSFEMINKRLQDVYEGLGEMRSLATGVGDLKKVLSNVKTRGVFGEVQLGSLLEQMLSPNQFLSQVATKPNSQERVDFAVKLPGKDDGEILLPIDAKFPIEDYQRLVEASEKADNVSVESFSKALEKRVKEEAKKIKEKYINVPNTTDFAILYLALEGLYAEVLRKPGLVEQLQREHKVIICGPTTLSALLSSLQLGFKTLSIEKRSSEIWSLLGTFKQEFGKFVDLLQKTQKKLSEASTTIEFATKKSKTIERKLKNVQTDQIDFEILQIEDEEENTDEWKNSYLWTYYNRSYNFQPFHNLAKRRKTTFKHGA